MKSAKLGAALAFSAGACWGIMGVTAQYLFEFFSFTAEGLVALRLIAGGLLILAFEALWFRKDILGPMRDPHNRRDIFFYGLGTGLMQYTFFLAIAASNAGTAAVLSGAIPLFLLLWQVRAEHRPPRVIELVCVLLAAFGITLLVTKGSLDALDFSVTGVAMGLASALCGAFCSIEPQRVLRRVSPVLVTGWGLFLGGLLILAAAPGGLANGIWSLRSLLCVLVVVVVGTVTAFVCYLTSLRLITAPTAGLLSCSEPLTAVVFTALVLGTRFEPMELVGAACIVGCVLLVDKTACSRKSA
ncbi:MAG: DMT family transporter [Mesosutterella sp.]|nr:DMT family transporter [Mesosutterella sp.]